MRKQNNLFGLKGVKNFAFAKNNKDSAKAKFFKRALASFQLSVMIIATFSIAFIIAESDRVNGEPINSKLTYADAAGYSYKYNSATDNWIMKDPNGNVIGQPLTNLEMQSNLDSNDIFSLDFNQPAIGSPPPNPVGLANVPGNGAAGVVGNAMAQGSTNPEDYAVFEVPPQYQSQYGEKVAVDKDGNVWGMVEGAMSWMGKIESASGTLNGVVASIKAGSIRPMMGKTAALYDSLTGAKQVTGPAADAMKKAAVEGAKTATDLAKEATDLARGGAHKTIFEAFFPNAFKAGTFAGDYIAPLLDGALWGGIAAGVGYGIGYALGWSDNNKMALSMALGVGVFTARYLSTSSWFTSFFGNAAQGGTWMTMAPWVGWGIGAAVGVGIFLLMYRKQETEITSFKCLPWQAPRGGSDCDKCNSELYPCSEYRCKSLGQTCGLVNEGTTNPKCIDKSPNDVTPPTIKPNEEVITKGYKYANVKPMPPGAGFEIVGNDQKCVKAFTPLKFGIVTDEPAQCKIDYTYNSTDYESMGYYFGGTNIFDYNHTETMSLPSPSAVKNQSFVLNVNGEWTFYVRCIDGNGNYNTAPYAIRLCVDPAQDTTPPEILGSSIDNGGCVAANNNNALVEFYTNEPADCKWAHEDRDYDQMPYSMTCLNQIYQMNSMELYTCVANLSGISRDQTPFYVRCKDQPNGVAAENDRNPNRASYVFNLRTSEALKINKIKPTETVYSGTSPAPVNFEVETLFGCDNGKAVCFYSTQDTDESYIPFFQTNDAFHTQRQDLAAGTYNYFIKCVDGGGNVAKNSTRFSVQTETNPPIVARAYQEQGMLKIITLRESDCSYSFNNCDFTYAEGTDMPTGNTTIHVAEWQKDKTYYIKCRDQFKNEPADCSIILRPQDNFLK